MPHRLEFDRSPVIKAAGGFHDRADAAHRLANELRQLRLDAPVILAIPRGGVVLGAILAKELHAPLNILLARKLRAPGQPELALGAISEDGHVYLNLAIEPHLESLREYLKRECDEQRAELDRRKRFFRTVCPTIPLAGRTAIVVDDGIATGATMIASLQTLQAERPAKVIVAVPVAALDRLKTIEPWCDQIICLVKAAHLRAVGQCYEDFAQIDDVTVRDLLYSAGASLVEKASVS